MATEYLFSNNATTTLAQSVSPTATVLNVASGTGSLFPSPASGQAFAVTLVDAATGLTNEICYCTSRSGDQLTVVRGREGTNATSWKAGDTVANYITADVMESWLQESDLNGYATETWANGQFLKLAYSSAQTVTGEVVFSGATGFNAKITNAPASPTTGVGGDVPNTWWVEQYYARTTALQSETNARIEADTNLQNQVNNRVLKTGDTSTGSQVTRNKYDDGTLHWAPGWTSIIAGLSGGSSNGEYSFGMFAQILDGVYTAGILSLNGFQGRKDFRFNEDGNIFTPLGTVALKSDLGSYVTADTYSSDFATSDSRVINLAYGHKIQVFTATVYGSSQTVTFPQSFSSTNGLVVLASCSLQPGYTNRAGLVQVNSWNTSSANVTTFFMDAPNLSFATAGLPCYFIAIGPK